MTYLLFPLIGLSLQPQPAPSRIAALKLPADGHVPGIAVLADGRTAVAFGDGDNAWLAILNPNGEWAGAPVRINAIDGNVVSGKERGPRLAVAPDGTLHVAWFGHKPQGIWYARSNDGGRTFTKEQNVLDKDSPCEGATIAVNAEGHVLVAWMDGRLKPDSRTQVSSAVFTAVSLDGGRTFSQHAPISPRSEDRACACCEPAVAAAGREWLLLFRGALDNIRDMRLYRRSADSAAWSGSTVSPDNWKYPACPMAGGMIAASMDDKQLAVVWRSRESLYLTISRAGSGEFAERLELTERGAAGHHPTVAFGSDGAVLVAWYANGGIQWKAIDPKSRQTTAHGTIKGAAPHRPAIVPRAGGGFWIIHS